MSEMLVGYARCSTDGQDLTVQRDALAGFGVAAERIYVDHGLTGANRDRPGLREALAACRANGRVGYWNYLNASLIALDGRAVSRVQLRSLLMRGRHSSRRGV